MTEVLIVSLKDCRVEAEFEMKAEADDVKHAVRVNNVLAVFTRDCLDDAVIDGDDELVRDERDDTLLTGAPLENSNATINILNACIKHHFQSQSTTSTNNTNPLITNRNSATEIMIGQPASGSVPE